MCPSRRIVSLFTYSTQTEQLFGSTPSTGEHPSLKRERISSRGLDMWTYHPPVLSSCMNYLLDALFLQLSLQQFLQCHCVNCL